MKCNGIAALVVIICMVLTVFVIVITTIVFLIGLGLFEDELTSVLGYATFLVLSLTLLAIIWYVWETNKLARSSAKMAEIQTKTYEESRDPVISFVIDLDDQGNQRTYLDPLQLPQKLITFVRAQNHSPFDALALIDLNLMIDNKPSYEVGPKYTGKEPWNLQAGLTVSGTRFEIKSIFDSQGNFIVNDMNIRVKIKYWSKDERILEKREQRWHFKFQDKKWIFDV